MASRRSLKLAQAVREVVGMSILADIKDPRVSDVTVTRVEVSGDLRQGKVYVSVMGDETKQNLCLKGLQSAAGFFQSKLNNRIETRYTPKLEFVLDQGVKNSLEVARILQDVLPENAGEQPAGHEDPESDAPVSKSTEDAPPADDVPPASQVRHE